MLLPFAHWPDATPSQRPGVPDDPAAHVLEALRELIAKRMQLIALYELLGLTEEPMLIASVRKQLAYEQALLAALEAAWGEMEP